jgi:hypothetical protein
MVSRVWVFWEVKVVTFILDEHAISSLSVDVALKV